MSSVSNVSSNYLETLLASALNSTNSTKRTSESTSAYGSSSTSSLSSQSDNAQLSPFSQLLSTLQNLQQSDPSEYKSLMGQISTNLADAAKTATADGDTNAATQLTQLSNDFKSAGQSGDLPNIQDLAKALDGQGGPGGGPPPTSDSTSTTDSSSSSSSTTSASSSSSTDASKLASALTDKILAAFHLSGSSGSQDQSLDAMSIIMSTLANAGVYGSSTQTS